MPISVQFSVRPSEALRLGLPYFDMALSGWGGGTDITSTSDGSGLLYPFFSSDVRLPAPRGIAIHPESDFDRVLVETSVGVGIGQDGAHTAPLNMLSYTVSVDTPLVLAPPTVPAAVNGVLPTPTLKLRAMPNGIFHTSYAKSGTASLSGFVTATVPLTDPVRSAINTPRLILRFYLQTPPPTGLQRAVQVFPRQVDNMFGARTFDPITIDAAETSGEQLFAIIPIHGRNCVTTIFRAIDCTPTIRVAVNDFASGDLAPTATPVAGDGCVQMERTLATTLALTSNVPVQASYSPASDWLMLYYTPSDGDNGLLMWQVRTSS